MFKRIDMSDYRTVAKDFDKRQAKRAGLPIWLRIVHAAGAEMNRRGHAEFGGWLNLASYIQVDGEKMPSRSKIYEGVKKAIELGYFTLESDVVCLVQSSYDTQKAAKSGYGCKHHDIKTEAVEIDEETGEILETESPVCPANELVVSEVPKVISVPETLIVQQDEPVLTDEEVLAEDVFGGVDEVSEVLASAQTPSKAKGYFYNPRWRRDLEDDMTRAIRAVEYANENSNSMVTVGTGDDREW